MSVTGVDRMGALLERVARDGKLEFAEADAIAHEALKGTLGDTRLREVKAFFESPPTQVEEYRGVTADAGGQSLTQTLYWGMPRELRGHSQSGQHFSESTSQSASEYLLVQRPEYPLALTVEGAARRAYTLSFRIAEQELSVNIPKGATPAQTAARVAEAINRHSDAIAASSLGEGALHFTDSDAYCTGVKAKADGSTVRLAPRIDA